MKVKMEDVLYKVQKVEESVVYFAQSGMPPSHNFSLQRAIASGTESARRSVLAFEFKRNAWLHLLLFFSLGLTEDFESLIRMSLSIFKI